MEGAPFSSNESPDDRQREAADTDNSKDEKDKKRRRRSTDAGAAALHASRLDFDSGREKGQEHEKASDRLGELTLSDAFGMKREGDNDAADKKAAKEKAKATEQEAPSPEKVVEPTKEVDSETVQRDEADQKQPERAQLGNDEAAEPARREPVEFTEDLAGGNAVESFDTLSQASEAAPDAWNEEAEASEAAPDRGSPDVEEEFEPQPTANELLPEPENEEEPEELEDPSASGYEELESEPTDEAGDEDEDLTASSTLPPAGGGSTTGSTSSSPGGGGSGGGSGRGRNPPPPPPPPPRPTPPPPPPPPPRPVPPIPITPPPGGRGGMPAPAFNVAPNAAPNAPVAQAERPVVIEKHNHFWAGVVAGGLYEHFKHKKRENKLKKEMDEQKDELQQQENRQRQSDAEVEKLKTKQTDTNRIIEQHERAIKQREQEAAHTAKMEQKPTASRVGEITTESIARVEAAAQLQVHAETALPEPERAAARDLETNMPHDELPLPPLMAQERGPAPKWLERSDIPAAALHAEQGRLTQKDTKLSPETAPVLPPGSEDEPLHVADDHRIEQSSWLSMEVDKRTGRVAEDQSFSYGQGFEQERHEVGSQPADNGYSQQMGGDANGALPGGAAASGNGASILNGDSRLPPASPTGAPLAASQKQNPIEQTQRIDDKGSDSGLTIAIAGAAVVAGAALLVLLFM